MIDTDALLIAFAILFGGIALVIVFLIYLSERVFSQKPDEYITTLPSRIVAIIIDIAILSFVIDLVLRILNPGYISLFFIPFEISSLNPFAILLILIMAIGASVLSFLFFYIPLFGGINFSITSLLIAIFGFLYFFVFDAFLEGRTAGRLVLRLKTLHDSKNRTLSAGEAGINAIGKTFLILDLVLGSIVSIFYSSNRGLRQVRLTQKLARAVTMDTSFNNLSNGNSSQSFLRDDNESGKLW